MSHGDVAWERYGRALHAAMAEVLAELPEEVRPHVLETADYWISVGLTIGLEHPRQAQRLLELIEAEEIERAALTDDAIDFLGEALA
jgi:epoxyqueuosine reductase QueG